MVQARKGHALPAIQNSVCLIQALVSTLQSNQRLISCLLTVQKLLHLKGSESVWSKWIMKSIKINKADLRLPRFSLRCGHIESLLLHRRDGSATLPWVWQGGPGTLERLFEASAKGGASYPISGLPGLEWFSDSVVSSSVTTCKVCSSSFNEHWAKHHDYSVPSQVVFSRDEPYDSS